MSFESKNAETFFQVDAPAIVELEPKRKSGPRYRTAIRGWRPGVCVLVDLVNVPELLAMRMQPGQAVAVRFVAEGKACAFLSTLRDWQSNREFPQMWLSWPDKVEYVRVRRHERVTVSASCAVRMPGGPETEGRVRDVSRGGCAIELPEDSTMERDAKLAISFDLPDGARVDSAAAVARSVRREAGAVIVGLCFDESLDKDTAADIEFFVSSTLERLRAAPSSTQRVLLLTSKLSGEDACVAALGNLGCEVHVVEEPVDAFFQLRLNRPAVFVAAADGILPGAEVCRVVRGDRFLKGLPIVIYRAGEPVDDTGKEAVLEAGANRYIEGVGPGEALSKCLEEILAGRAT